MMTSKVDEHTLCSLLFKTTSDYNANLQTLLTLINKTPKNSFIVAPEVCLSGFDYANIEDAVAFSKEATLEILKASTEKIVILTMLEKHEGQIFNTAKIFFNEEVVYERSKARLFKLGDEHKYMAEGSDENFEIVEVNGIKIAIFICFELRFKELWKKAEGADVIATPSWWGVPRAEHFKALTQTLAIMNQCYVIASDSLNEECSKMSAIITPNGEVTYNGNKPCLEQVYKKKEISLMRRYIDVGIK
ncbi:carbon-nitrogen hydrolase family protein [Sulfurimonas aquatica]|uniref:Carbon-nitrogen hydrolase family protein n=1 Tax=Sulfurimonas aquatica TaxID=2672570 RepID=A0A975AXW4_9BACT|nr:carbon-nitrogen hydrolase family protein [Sulfurimonas aquatica]QSZ40586.1 carbon-nitrogen hydrolase family protein [Sulfurimonas aquatica]